MEGGTDFPGQEVGTEERLSVMWNGTTCTEPGPTLMFRAYCCEFAKRHNFLQHGIQISHKLNLSLNKTHLPHQRPIGPKLKEITAPSSGEGQTPQDILCYAVEPGARMIQHVEEVHPPSICNRGQSVEDRIRVAWEAGCDQMDSVAGGVHQCRAQGR